MSSVIYDADQPLILDEKANRSNLTCSQLMEMVQYNTFDIHKLSYRMNMKCLPTWKNRTLIIACGFIFKYASPSGLFIKGVPIDLSHFSVENNNEYGENTIVLSSLSKSYVFRFSDSDTVNQFINEIAKQREWRIKSNMHHIAVTNSEKYVIMLAENLCKTKERINKSIAMENIYSME